MTQNTTIEGRLIAVMESWPLQLTVDVGGEKVAVVLSETALVRRGGIAAQVTALLPQSRVRIDGEETSRSPRALLANRIELLE